ncbi:MAG: PorV/PorQ family protein [Candidatus Zixiibacteriota bacterium]
MALNNEQIDRDCAPAGFRYLFLPGILALFLLLWAAPAQVHAQAKVGTTGAQFLELGVSARAMGMAEAFTSVADDITAVYYNPAGLTSLYSREAVATYISLPAGINYGFAAAGFPLESIGGVLGIAAYALSSGDIIETTSSRGTSDGSGRTFAWNDLALSFSYGRYLTDRFSIGFSVKYLNETAHDYSANGWSADVGTNYNTGYRDFKIAMVITNFGPDMKFIDDDFPLPINFRFGGSINVMEGVDNLVTFAAEGSHPSDNLEKYNGGMEWTYKDRFTLRGGHRFNYDVDGFTFGGGLRLPFGEDQEMRFDYAFQDYGILTEVHRFTVVVAF